MGGWSAAKLRWAGFDGLIFKGKADKPVYAYVEDGQVDTARRLGRLGHGRPRHVEVLRRANSARKT
jgi:aldehyde:ferredoxin oxidoreductase